MQEADLEVAKYFLSLLEHGCKCYVPECPTCQTLHDILDRAKERIFAGPPRSNPQPGPNAKADARTSGSGGRNGG
jgi:hypothetical protein